MMISIVNELLLSTISIKNKYKRNVILFDSINNNVNDIIVSKTFEPQFQAETLTSMGLVSITLLVVTLYWWNIVIPAKRTEVAISKNRGDIKEYLDDIRDNDEKAIEQWFLSDWLNKTKNKPSAVPFLKKAKVY